MTKQKETRIRKLIAALRSGKYKQTKFSLHDSTGYCCLGVACEVMRRSRKQGDIKWQKAGSTWVFRVGDYQEAAILPRPVQNYYGLTAQGKLDVRSSMMVMNDSDELTFEQIADKLEAWLDKQVVTL